MNKVFSIKNLSAGYDETVLHDISFDVAAGEFIALIGPNGVGKSTLLKTIEGLLPAPHGSVALNGRALEKMSAAQIAKELSAVNRFTGPLPPFAVEDFVAMGLFPHQGLLHLAGKDDNARIEEVLELCGIAHLFRRPLGELSGGELQLAFVARALLQNKRLILLDEPVSYLDVKHIVMIMELLARLNEGGSTIITALHDLNLASSYCSRIIALKEGRLFFDGSPEEVISSKSIKSLFEIGCKIGVNPLNDKPFAWFAAENP